MHALHDVPQNDLVALVGGHRILKNKLIPFGRKGGHAPVEPVSEARPETSPAFESTGTQKTNPVPEKKVPLEQIISPKESDEDFMDF